MGGTDDDYVLELHPQGKARLIYYGNAIRRVGGTYHVVEPAEGSSDVLVFSPSDPEDTPWPTTVMYADGSELLLIPADANRAHPWDTRLDLWPFRQTNDQWRDTD
jgi:hypothetical protein